LGPLETAYQSMAENNYFRFSSQNAVFEGTQEAGCAKQFTISVLSTDVRNTFYRVAHVDPNSVLIRMREVKLDCVFVQPKSDKGQD
jgi:hypothetical protein